MTPVMFFYLQQWMGWRAVFQVFAAVGVLWAAMFYRSYRDNPRESKRVNAAELALVAKGGQHAIGNRNVPWKVFLSSRSAWLLCGQWFCYSYGFYFYLTWLPSYLQQARHLDVHQSAMLAGLPLFSAGLGSIFSGWVCAWLMRRTRRVAGVRRSMAFWGFGPAASLLVVFIYLSNPISAMIALTVSSFAAEFTGPVSWTTCMDLGGRYVGSLAGGMNTLGQLGGAAAPAIIGYILEWTKYNWPVAFYVAVAVNLAGIVCWVLIDPVTPLDTGAGVVEATAPSP